MHKVFVLSIMSFLLAGSCSYFANDRDEPAAARVANNYLYLSDVASRIPEGISPRDSLSMAKNIVNQWVQKQMLINQAKENLPENDEELQRKVDNYRNELLVHQYETQIIKRKADTSISRKEIEKYYDKNKDNFVLEREILKINYIVLPLEYENTQEAREVFFNADNTSEIESYCKENNFDYFLEPIWIHFEDAAKSLPLRITSVSGIKYSTTELTDNAFRYLVQINGTRAAGEIKPLEFVSSEIKNILLNRRRLELLKQMREDIVSTGFKNNEIEVY